MKPTDYLLFRRSLSSVGQTRRGVLKEARRIAVLFVMKFSMVIRFRRKHHLQSWSLVSKEWNNRPLFQVLVSRTRGINVRGKTKQITRASMSLSETQRKKRRARCHSAKRVDGGLLWSTNGIMTLENECEV